MSNLPLPEWFNSRDQMLFDVDCVFFERFLLTSLSLSQRFDDCDQALLDVVQAFLQDRLSSADSFIKLLHGSTYGPQGHLTGSCLPDFTQRPSLNRSHLPRLGLVKDHLDRQLQAQKQHPDGGRPAVRSAISIST